MEFKGHMTRISYLEPTSFCATKPYQCMCSTVAIQYRMRMSPCYHNVYRVSDETGSLETTLVAEGDLNRGYLDPKDVFLVDTGKELFVWVGSGASSDEKKNAMTYAHVSFCLSTYNVHALAREETLIASHS